MKTHSPPTSFGTLNQSTSQGWLVTRIYLQQHSANHLTRLENKTGALSRHFVTRIYTQQYSVNHLTGLENKTGALSRHLWWPQFKVSILVHNKWLDCRTGGEPCRGILWPEIILSNIVQIIWQDWRTRREPCLGTYGDLNLKSAFWCITSDWIAEQEGSLVTAFCDQNLYSAT